MNNLEKINTLISTGGRTVVYGQPLSVPANPVVSLAVGESDKAEYSLGDIPVKSYTTVNVSVYAADYLTGYNLLLDVKYEIQTAAKTTVNIIFANFGESEYDKDLQRYVLKSKYKIIE